MTDRLKGKPVLFRLETQNLGDNLAWFPYIVEFSDLHECETYVMTKWFSLFRSLYPKYKFIGEQTAAKTDFAKSYFFYIGTPHFNGSHWRRIPLQKFASVILDLPYAEKHIDVSSLARERPISDKYITFSTTASMTCKEWNRENGWGELICRLESMGYKPVDVTLERKITPYSVSENLVNGALTYINYSDFYIGSSSGLAWISRALNKHVFTIGGFSESFTEFQTKITRVQNLSVCNGCYNDVDLEFDRSKEWCPRNNDYICSKSITVDMVIEAIKEFEHEKEARRM